MPRQHISDVAWSDAHSLNGPGSREPNPALFYLSGFRPFGFDPSRGDMNDRK